ncbi:MAG TPA: hypothetical protein VFA43_04855 [Gemmatimonadaceae bacterium]|nr:hypothetical protein [Gemmatimonadaceae bacterium]
MRTRLFLLLFCALPASAVAQVTWTASGVLMVVSDEIQFGGLGDQRVTGVAVGAEIVAMPLRNTEFRGQISAGHLNSDTPATDSRGWTDIQLGGSVFATNWLAFQLGADARGYSTVVGDQRWISLSAGAEARAPLFDNAAQAVFRASFLPLVGVSNHTNPDFAVSAATGLRFQRKKLQGAVLFSLERYSFPSSSLGAHAEQVAMLSLQLGVRFPK